MFTVLAAPLAWVPNATASTARLYARHNSKLTFIELQRTQLLIKVSVFLSTYIRDTGVKAQCVYFAKIEGSTQTATL